MNVHIPLALFFIVLAYILRFDKTKTDRCFILFMLLSMILAAIRFEYGPDYFQYLTMYDRLDERGVAYYIEHNEHIEPLFLYFLHSFSSYWFFIAVQSVLWFGTVLLFLRNRYDTRYLWLVVFLLFFDVNNVIENYTAIRSSFVGILFLIALPYLSKNRFIYVLLMTLAFFIHHSSAPLLLLVFIGGKSKRGKSLLVPLTLVIAVVAFFMGDYIGGPFTNLLMERFPGYFAKYSYYMEEMFTQRSVSLGNLIFLCMNVFIIMMLISGLRKESDREYIIYYKIAIILSLMSVLFGNMLMSRINMNVAPLLIVLYTRTLRYIRPDYRLIFLTCVILITLFNFYNVINSDYAESFQVYKTILSQ